MASKMEMDQDSLNLCRRLETNLITVQSNMAAVLHLLRGNELDDESGLVNQIKQFRLEKLLSDKREEENKKIMFEKMNTDKQVLENRIELLKLEMEKRIRPLEMWKSKLVGMGIGVGILGGYFLKALFDKIF